MTALESWRYGNPEKVYERIEEQEIRNDQRLIGGFMGQKLQSVPEKVQYDMHQWADWARRPQFWANLNVTPFCKLLGIKAGGGEVNFRLDPQSMAIHKGVMSLEDKYKIIVYAYFVAGVWHEDKPEIFNGHGISRSTYYRRLGGGDKDRTCSRNAVVAGMTHFDAKLVRLFWV